MGTKLIGLQFGSDLQYKLDATSNRQSNLSYSYRTRLPPCYPTAAHQPPAGDGRFPTHPSSQTPSPCKM